MRLRRWMMAGGVGAALAGAGFAGLRAQGTGAVVVQESTTTATPTGTVTGKVIAQDTQQPARFASVMLQSVAAASGEGGDGPRFGGGGGVNTRTDAEGGVYGDGCCGWGLLRDGECTGVCERAGAVCRRRWPVGPIRRRCWRGFRRCMWMLAGRASVTVTMERGGTIAGKVQWEDGSPAAGISMSALAWIGEWDVGGLGFVQLPGVLQGIQSPGGGSNFATTDDRGAFRIAGLAPGEYLLRTTIQQPIAAGREVDGGSMAEARRFGCTRRGCFAGRMRRRWW